MLTCWLGASSQMFSPPYPLLQKLRHWKTSQWHFSKTWHNLMLESGSGTAPTLMSYFNRIWALSTPRIELFLRNSATCEQIVLWFPEALMLPRFQPSLSTVSGWSLGCWKLQDWKSGSPTSCLDHLTPFTISFTNMSLTKPWKQHWSTLDTCKSLCWCVILYSNFIPSRHMEVPFRHIENSFLLNKLYLNTVFSHWRKLCKQEALESGAVAKNSALNRVYKRRIDVRKSIFTAVKHILT